MDVAVPGFLTVRPLSIGTQDVQLPTSLVTRILYFQEQPLLAEEEAKKSIPEPVQEVTDRDFEVFYRHDVPSTSHHPVLLAQASSSQEEAHISEGMGKNFKPHGPTRGPR